VSAAHSRNNFATIERADPVVERMPDIFFAERVAALGHNGDRDPSRLAKSHDRIGMALPVFLANMDVRFRWRRELTALRQFHQPI
jgi:hypothetical protein